MGKHLRKLFSADQVKEEFRRYLARQIGVDQASAMLKIRRRQFFKLLNFTGTGERVFLCSTREDQISHLPNCPRLTRMTYMNDLEAAPVKKAKRSNGPKSNGGESADGSWLKVPITQSS